MDEKLWKIGELAALAGVTVRTLHHYEEVGLLVAPVRSEAGHRSYDGDSLHKLYRILAMRRLGFRLEDIAVALDGNHIDLREIVRRHLAQLQEQLEMQEALCLRLTKILDALEREDPPSTQDFVDALEVMTMHEQYYTPEQLAELEQRSNALGPDGMKRAEQDWAELLKEVESEHARGADPAGPRMQELAARWQALIDAFTGGDPAMFASLKKMYDEQGAEQASRGMVDPALMDFMGKALSARGNGS